MTRALPFTEASLARRIKGAEKAGKHAVAITVDGTVLIADKPLDVTSIVPAEAPISPLKGDLDRELAEFEARHGQD
jgi:hypothetical protein